MSSERFLETTGETVEEAIAKGLEELGVNHTDVIVEVLEEPSRGVFGLGARPARVRLQLLSTSPPPPPQAPVETPASPQTPVAERRADRPRRERRPQRRAPQREPDELADLELAEEDDDDAASLFRESQAIVPESEMDEEAQVGQVVLNEILERMSIRANVVVRRAQPSHDGEEVPYILDVTGGDLTRLIGRRGETLASLQYVTRLITSRELQRRANIIVDINGYKARRAKLLHGLAVRMADQAVERGRTVSLEPMPPHERRIIHLALRERDDVTTKSVGEGSGRKVTIVPKNEA